MEKVRITLDSDSVKALIKITGSDIIRTLTGSLDMNEILLLQKINEELDKKIEGV